MNISSWEVLLGMKPIPQHLYKEIEEGRKPEAKFVPNLHDASKAISLHDRTILRRDIRSYLVEKFDYKTLELYGIFMTEGLIPRLENGKYLTASAFSKYFRKVKDDMQKGITDELIIYMYVDQRKTLQQIRNETLLSINNIRDRLIANGLLNARKF